MDWQGSPGPAHTASPAWKGTLCDVLRGSVASLSRSCAIEIHLRAGVGGKVMQSPRLSSTYMPRDLGKSHLFLASMSLKDYFK